MKKLPKTSRGFTLIELMVVISIIAILSLIGITVFTNSQAAARDGRRRGDIDAISSALESARQSGTTTYATITGSAFANGNIPKDPSTNTDYCIATNTVLGATPPPGPTSSTWSVNNRGNCNNITVPGVAYSGFSSATTNTAASWTICALLEQGSQVYCKYSRQ